MFGDGSLTFREFAMREPLPLAAIQDAVLEFLRGRDDAILFGAQAVNAYVDEPRMTQDVDILSPRAPELVEAIKGHLAERFHVALRIRDLGGDRGYRLYQVAKPKNRHLVDVRPVVSPPPAQRVHGVLVVSPAELIAEKVFAFHRRRGKPKAGTDWRDLAMLVLTFPELKRLEGPVRARLVARGASPAILATWADLVAEEIVPEDEDDDDQP